MTTYIQAIGKGFPTVECHAIGDGSQYSDLVWDGGSPLPSQATLDEWIASNLATSMIITRYQFRKLFSLEERVAIDNAYLNTSIPANYRAMVVTMLKDLELSSEVQLDNPDIAMGVGLLEQLGLIAVGRGDEILSNVSPQ